MPDAVVLVNLSAQDAFQRKHGADQNDRLEQAGLCFHQKVYEGFLACANEESERFIVVDGKKSIEEMAKDVVAGLIARGIIE